MQMLSFETDLDSINKLFHAPLISFNTTLGNFWFAVQKDGGERDTVFPMSLSLACGTYRRVKIHQVATYWNPASNHMEFTVFTEDNMEPPYKFAISHKHLVSPGIYLPSMSNVILFRTTGDNRNYYDMLVALYLELHPEHAPNMFLEMDDWLNMRDCMHSIRSNYIQSDMTEGDCQATLFSLRAFCGMVPTFPLNLDNQQ